MSTITFGGRIEDSLPLKPVRIAVLTVSDTRDVESDTSGKILAGRITDYGHELAERAVPVFATDHAPVDLVHRPDGASVPLAMPGKSRATRQTTAPMIAMSEYLSGYLGPFCN